jgi:membrane protein
MNAMPSIFALLKKTALDFNDDNALRLAAALAYYSVFSIGPLLIIVVAIAGAVFGDEAVNGELQRQLSGIVGPDGASVIQSMVASARKPSDSAFASLIGVALLLMGASGVFVQLKDALNTIWNVTPASSGGVKGLVLKRFLSFSMVLGIGFLLLISMVVTTVLAAVSGYLERVVPVPAEVWQLTNLAVSFGVITLLFAMIFKLLPDADIRWRDVWIGAAATSALFAVGKYVLGMYLGRESASSAYGAAGSLVLILSWVYYSSVILLFGAELTQNYAEAHGSQIVARGKSAERGARA